MRLMLRVCLGELRHRWTIRIDVAVTLSKLGSAVRSPPTVGDVTAVSSDSSVQISIKAEHSMVLAYPA